MGVVADFTSVPADVWPTVLTGIRAGGIAVEGGELDRGSELFQCVRGRCCVTLAYSHGDGGREVCLWCSAVRFWRRPLGMWRLCRDVRRAVLAVGGQPA